MRAWRACVPDEDGPLSDPDNCTRLNTKNGDAATAAEIFVSRRQDEGSADGDTVVVHIVEIVEDQASARPRAFAVEAHVRISFIADEIELEVDEVSR